MKKLLAVVLTVCVIFGAGAAFAQGRGYGRNFDGQRDIQNMNRSDFDGRGRNFERCGFDGRGFRGNFTPDMPKEIREKAVELAKLRVDLEEAMTSNPINKAKALETFKKIQLIENEIDTWKFEKRLDFMEKMKEARKNRIQKFDDDEKNEPDK
ncbi:MAG: hypothetical protein IJQ57_06280 [Synergistaceae bacterium]|nr:hypothetical protein [Synergistaceae bacterium]